MTQNQKAMAGIKPIQFLKPKCARRAANAKGRPGYLEAARAHHHNTHLRRLAAREEAQRQEQARQEAAAKKLAQEAIAREAELLAAAEASKDRRGKRGKVRS
jgi:hypothetical protein